MSLTLKPYNWKRKGLKARALCALRHGSFAPLVCRAIVLVQTHLPDVRPGAVSGRLLMIDLTNDGWLGCDWTSVRAYRAFASSLNRAYAETGGRTVRHFVDGVLAWAVLDCGRAGEPRAFEPPNTDPFPNFCRARPHVAPDMEPMTSYSAF